MATDFQRFSALFFRGNRFSTVFGSFFSWRPIFNGFRLFFFVATDFQRFSAPFFHGNRFSTVFGSFFSWQPIFNGFWLLFFVATNFQRFSAPFFRGNRFSTVFGSFFSWRPIINLILTSNSHSFRRGQPHTDCHASQLAVRYTDHLRGNHPGFISHSTSPPSSSRD